MVARALAVAHTCIYDAWAAFDAVAVGTRLGDDLRQPLRTRSLSNTVEAVSYAAYRAAVDLFPEAKTTVFDPLMAELRFDPADRTTDTSTAAGVGNRACQAVLDFRHGDGSNQLAGYADPRGYRPVNEPMDLRKTFKRDTVRDPNRWQPLTYTDARGAVVTPPFIAPHWNTVLPFAMARGSELRSSIGPAAYPSPAYTRQALEVLERSATLNDRKKVMVEYWADGPGSELPPGHWNRFAQFVARRDRHGAGEAGVEADTKLFFALNNALFDAGIVAWDNKVHHDSVRPITAIRWLFEHKRVRAWGGPYKGTRLINGEDWLPYQPASFPTPPFAEFSSGHSTFSAAAAEILKRFTGSDHFGRSATFRAGTSRVEPGATPAQDVTLSWGTFSQAADQAGSSRLYGGIHFRQGDLDARANGRTCGTAAWNKAQSYFAGKQS